MGRRGTISRKAKTRPGKTTKPKRNDASTAAHPVSSTLTDLQEQVSALAARVEPTAALSREDAVTFLLFADRKAR
jgi:hypothetical protein